MSAWAAPRLLREVDPVAHSFHSTSLREYDMRGTYGDRLTEDKARALGRSSGTMVQRKGVRHCVNNAN